MALSGVCDSASHSCFRGRQVSCMMDDNMEINHRIRVNGVCPSIPILFPIALMTAAITAVGQAASTLHSSASTQAGVTSCYMTTAPGKPALRFVPASDDLSIVGTIASDSLVATPDFDSPVGGGLKINNYTSSIRPVLYESHIVTIWSPLALFPRTGRGALVSGVACDRIPKCPLLVQSIHSE